MRQLVTCEELMTALNENVFLRECIKCGTITVDYKYSEGENEKIYASIFDYDLSFITSTKLNEITRTLEKIHAQYYIIVRDNAPAIEVWCSGECVEE